jgi:hypothetical protein
VGDLLFDAYLTLAYSLAERDVIDRAQEYIREAEEYLEYVSDSELKAMHADRKGWIIYKQVKLGEGNDINESIKYLKIAVSRSASAEYYLHLALALEYKLEVEGEKLLATGASRAELQCNLGYALACCDHVKDLDRGIKKSLTERAKELQKRLGKMERANKKATSSKEEDSNFDPAHGYV